MNFLRRAATLGAFAILLAPVLSKAAPPTSESAANAGSGSLIEIAKDGSKAEAPRITESAARQMEGIQRAKARALGNSGDRKINSRLLRTVDAARSSARYPEVSSLRRPQLGSDGRIKVELVPRNAQGVREIMKGLSDVGADTLRKSFAYPSVTARLTPAQIESMSQHASVKAIRQADLFLNNKQARKRERLGDLAKALNVSEGVAAHNTLQARATYGVDGSGQKVCVLSDGVDSLAASQASGDLPATVDVLAGQAGEGDEGTAMLEIIHDMAPGAALGFATANSTPSEFATNILGLQAAGCTIIVDDIIYLVESPFHELEITDAVNQVTAAGVLYFSSAGNEGSVANSSTGGWEGNFNPNGTPASLSGAGLVHNFGDGGQSNLVNAGAQVVTLHWTDPWGGSGNDYDLYIMNGALDTIFDASTDTQDGTGDPVEIAGETFSGERLVVAQFSGVNRLFNLLAFRGVVAQRTTGTTRGHSTALAAYSVAAVDATQPGVPPFTTAAVEEDFTSDGPRRIFYGFDGNLLPGAPAGDLSATGGIVRQKPDIAAADGVATASPGFNPFYGTSAAAPHAAAIAALIKQAVPGVTPAQMRTALTSTALDIAAPGVDIVTGAGIVMPGPAMASLGATAVPSMQYVSETHVQVNGNGDAAIDSGEDWRMTINVTNAGGAPATNVVVTLIPSTAGLVVTSPPVVLGTVAAGANSAATPFNFSLLNVACAASLQFTVRITSSNGATVDTPVTLFVGGIGPEQTFSYGGPAVAIPDAADLTGSNPGALVVVPVTVAGLPQPVARARFSINGSACSNASGSTTVGIDHSFVNDLRLRLQAPGGAEIALITNTDGSGNNFCQTVLEDSASNPIQGVVTANAPFTGSFQPAQALSGLQGVASNGTWNLTVQDFFSGDIGNVRAFSVMLSPATCTPFAATAALSATKTVAGSFVPGGTVTYTITIRNNGNAVHPDNAGNELVDNFPAALTVQTATATSGTAAFAGNQVTWNGAIDAGATVTVTVTAQIAANAAGPVSNQATLNFDANRDGSNDSTALSDDPGQPGASDPTVFVVGNASVSATKVASGSNFTVGSPVTYTIVLTNSGTIAAGDNPGNEFTDVLPAGLQLTSASASSGTAVATLGSNTVTWNGAIAAGGSVTITINALVTALASGSSVSNQATFSYDSNGDGTNDANGVSDDPSVAGAANATVIQVAALVVPTLSQAALGLLALLLLGLVAGVGRRQLR